MKKFGKVFGTLSIITLMLSCSSTVKVSDSWKDVDMSSIKDKTVMVMNRTEDETVRKQFEIDMVEKLKEKEITSIESYKIISEMNLDEKPSKAELNEVKENLVNNGVDVVLVTVVKDVKEYTETTTSGGSSGYYMGSSPIYYRRGYHRGFYRYYNTGYYVSEPTSFKTSTAKKYVLETLMYDLTLPEDNQLLSVVTTVVDNPETLGTTSKDFSNKVVKELIK